MGVIEPRFLVSSFAAHQNEAAINPQVSSLCCFSLNISLYLTFLTDTHQQVCLLLRSMKAMKQSENHSPQIVFTYSMFQIEINNVYVKVWINFSTLTCNLYYTN